MLKRITALRTINMVLWRTISCLISCSETGQGMYVTTCHMRPVNHTEMGGGILTNQCSNTHVLQDLTLLCMGVLFYEI